MIVSPEVAEHWLRAVMKAWVKMVLENATAKDPGGNPPARNVHQKRGWRALPRRAKPRVNL